MPDQPSELAGSGTGMWDAPLQQSTNEFAVSVKFKTVHLDVLQGFLISKLFVHYFHDFHRWCRNLSYPRQVKFEVQNIIDTAAYSKFICKNSSSSSSTASLPLRF